MKSFTYLRSDTVTHAELYLIIQVSPFDLVKVIETFVRHDRGLPLSLRQYLGTCGINYIVYMPPSSSL